MRFTTVSTMALGFAALTVGQFQTTVTSVSCVVCTTGTQTRSNGYTAPTTDSSDLTRTITKYRRQDSPSSTCTSITDTRVDITEYLPPISTHIQCGPDKATPTCSTSYECGCHSTHYTRPYAPDTHLCFPDETRTISYPDFGGGRTQPGRGVTRAARQTNAPKQTWTRTRSQSIVARATSQDLGGRSQRRVAREAEATAVVAPRCEPGKFGPGCFPIIMHPVADAIDAREAESTAVAARCEPGKFGPGCFPIIIHPPSANAVEARQDMSTSCRPGFTGTDCHMCIPGRNEPGCPPSPWPPVDAATTPAPTATTSHYGCPSGVCGPGCRWGHECFSKLGRGAEATAVAEVVHSTLLTLRA
ncbi:hypothetical protein AA0115_g10427 [Alternaria tenuissima]|uniref:Uncharacterized protein n=1 Tax=Alternaria tenuissima TaxID=119927 RepID=A0AB37W943_9PLEO|nr:hypothetical protein AA0115_g10427 [Alternaria tenuissima]